jgi:hypothetical protein
MRFARGDARNHIVSHKNDQGASYWRYAVLQWWSRLKISFCAIFASFNFRLLQHYPPRNGHRQSRSLCLKGAKNGSDCFRWRTCD